MIALSDDRTRLQVDRVHAWLASSYWSPGVTRAQVERQIAGSHCLGAYDGAIQVGFARAITDHASFAWIDDVWVDERARGGGVARRMIEWFVEHPDFADVRRFALVTADAHRVYAGAGFHAPLRPDRWMERLSSDFAARLQASTR